MSPAGHMFLIEPHDENWLPRAVKRLRIFNDADEIRQIKIATVSGAVVTLLVPPLTLLFEGIRVARVFATGTSAGLFIHGYTDL